MPLSTLAVSKRMIDAGFTQQQAEAQAEIWADIVESDLASKRDLKEIDLKISTVEANLRRDIKDIEANLRRDIKELDAGLKRDIKELDVSLKRDIKELELKMDTWREAQTRLAVQMSMGTAVAVTTLVGFMIRFIGR